MHVPPSCTSLQATCCTPSVQHVACRALVFAYGALRHKQALAFLNHVPQSRPCTEPMQTAPSATNRPKQTRMSRSPRQAVLNRTRALRRRHLRRRHLMLAPSPRHLMLAPSPPIHARRLSYLGVIIISRRYYYHIIISRRACTWAGFHAGRIPDGRCHLGGIHACLPRLCLHLGRIHACLPRLCLHLSRIHACLPR